jgi:metallophosphoesterase (TIGR00282 family)
MRILFLGDIMGRSGRDCVSEHLAMVRQTCEPDVIIANAENAAHGAGLTDKICKTLYEDGVHVITTGNHVWDQREIMSYIDRDPNLLRPANYPEGTPGRGHVIYTLPDGRKILVLNVMGRLFMDPLDDPFKIADQIVSRHALGKSVQAIFIDFHAETTSEKMAFAHYFDGRVTGIVGTHTHIPTADAHILNHGTAYQTDAGMCGDYNSVIGVKKEVPIHRFTRKTPSERMSPASGEGTLCGVVIESDDKSGLAKKIFPLRYGPLLASTFD